MFIAPDEDALRVNGTVDNYLDTGDAIAPRLKAKLNDQLRTAKTIILGLALTMTVIPLVVATAWRAGMV